MNKKWRVIYHIDKKEITIFILEVNPHGYRKKLKQAFEQDFFAPETVADLTTGEMIKILREKNELSQNQLAEMTGLLVIFLLISISIRGFMVAKLRL